MLDSAVLQLRYVSALIANRSLRPDVLVRIVRDLVATVDEFGAPGDDAAMLPGQAQRVDPALQATMAARSLRTTARRAARHTAYYRQLFAGLDVTVDDLTPDTWGRLPVTPKAALRGLPAAFVSDLSSPVLQALTTGTTGTPTAVWFSRAELDILGALSTLGAMLGAGVRRHHVFAYAGCSRATVPLHNSMESVTRIGAAFTQFGLIDPALALERLAAPVQLRGKMPQVSHLICPPSYLSALVGAAEADGWDAADFGLVAIQTGGEILTEALSDRAEAALGVRPTCSYLMTEILPSGASRCRAGHLHYTPEFGHVELLDPQTYEPAAPGEMAVLVFTPYVPYRECTLLLRYVTGDLVRRLDDAPDCELAHLTASSDILGRYAGRLSLRVPSRDVLEVLECDPAVPLPARYFVEDCAVGAVVHVVAPDSGVLRDRILDCLTARGLSIAGVVLHDDHSELPVTMPVRADLREHSFERHRPQHATATAIGGQR